ncbi:MAG TPA: hypothetical protein VEQ85_05860 [Lacipirellulaceae bacterium]|nr:hypothetical protein [Lacipirellulaceae bacterium]
MSISDFASQVTQAMINRRPSEFRLPTANGTGHRQAAGELPQRVMTRAAHCVAQYPVAVLGAAFVIGLVVGRVVKR